MYVVKMILFTMANLGTGGEIPSDPVGGAEDGAFVVRGRGT